MTILTLRETDALVHLVRTHIEGIAHTKEGTIRIGLPGGRSAQGLIRGMLALDDATLLRLRIYLLDERLSGVSNSETLLDAGLSKAIETKRFSPTDLVVPEVGKPLLEKGNTQFDLVYLGVGEDGHVASLFPGSYPSGEKDQTVLVENSPKPPKKRVSFTYNGFLAHAKASPIFLLFLGEGKRDALNRLLANEERAQSLPCSFFTHQDFPVTVITDLEV